MGLKAHTWLYFILKPTKAVVQDNKDNEEERWQLQQNFGNPQAEGQVVTDLLDQGKLHPELGAGKPRGSLF